MSKREAIARYNLIIKKLRRGPCSLREIMDYLERESELQGYDFTVSARTFQRDLNDIRSLYNLDIAYDFSRKTYRMEGEERPEYTERILEAFDTYNMIQVSDRLSDRVYFEKRKPLGTEHFNGILHAIQNGFMIKFRYHKFYQEESEEKRVEPYALKESKNRWYVIGRNADTGKVKTYALDRLSHFEITKKRFSPPHDFDAEVQFRHSFGIIAPDGSEPHEITLWFSELQGKYIKSLPLHPSQKTVRDDKEGLVINLRVIVTQDFIMELLSYGDEVKVLNPGELAEELKDTYRRALSLYEKKPKKKKD